MSIYKIKRFTRADKRAFREFYKATNGLRTGSNLGAGMIARDSYRLSNLGNQWKLALKLGNTTPIDFNEAKTMLGHMGLKLGAKDIEHLADKYIRFKSDPKLAERYYLRLEYKLGQRKNPRFSPFLHYENFTKRLQNNKSKIKDPFINVSNNPSDIDKERSKSIWKNLENNGYLMNSVPDAINSCTLTPLAIKDIKGAYSSPFTNSSSRLSFSDKRDLIEGLHDIGINKNVRKKYFKNPNIKGLISSSPTSLPSIILHEHGHNVWEEKYPNLGRNLNSILTLADENGASAVARVNYKKYNNPTLEELNNLTKLLRTAHDSYFNDSLADIIHEVQPNGLRLGLKKL